jgi:hypothetical protein
MRPDDTATVRLGRVAHARSGDKGTGANVGVIADSDEIYEILREQLPANRVADFFRQAGATMVDRYELPNLRALNFVIRGVLGRITRADAQGKALGQAILEMTIDVPGRLLPVDHRSGS